MVVKREIGPEAAAFGAVLTSGSKALVPGSACSRGSEKLEPGVAADQIPMSVAVKGSPDDLFKIVR